jgi:hypothetical protein
MGRRNTEFITRLRDGSAPGPNPYRWQDLVSEEIDKGRNLGMRAANRPGSPLHAGSTMADGGDTSAGLGSQMPGAPLGPAATRQGLVGKLSRNTQRQSLAARRIHSIVVCR